jgi:hypothetical protein
MNLTAGEQAVFGIHCKLHGCNNWNSGYNLFELDGATRVDTIGFSPNADVMSINVGGGSYSFAPGAFTAGGIDTNNLSVFSAASIAVLKVPSGATGSSLLGGAVAASSDSPTVTSSATLHTLEIQGLNPANKRAAFTFANNFGGTLSSAYEFGTDLATGGVADFYIYNYATSKATVHALANDDIVFAGNVSAANFSGILLGATGSIGGTALAAGACANGTAAVTGAAVGQPVSVSASDGTLSGGLEILSAAVTSANTVTVQVCAAAAVTPTAKTYNVRVIE